MKEKECIFCGMPIKETFEIQKYSGTYMCHGCIDEAENSTMIIYKKCKVEIAHHIPDHMKCGNTHGHSLSIIVGVRGCMDVNDGMVMDFHTLKHYIQKEIVDKFDHKYLNDFLPIPTAEYMAFYIFKKLEQCGLNVASVRVQETENNYVEFTGERYV